MKLYKGAQPAKLLRILTPRTPSSGTVGGAEEKVARGSKGRSRRLATCGRGRETFPVRFPRKELNKNFSSPN
jgi:hypothetical protein